MIATIRKYGPAFAGVLLIVLGGAPPGHAYKGNGRSVGSGGGFSSGGGYRSVAAFGMKTMGSSSSASHTHQEGLLALYGRPVLYSEPATLAFGTVSTESSRLMTATIVNYGGVGLLLSDLGFASGGGSVFSVESPAGPAVVGPGDSLDVSVRFEPDSQGTVHDTLEGTTNDPAVPLWILALSGTGQSASIQDIAVAVDTLDFGPVPVDSTAELVFAVENVGGADLAVGPITVTGGVFSVTPDSFTVGAGGLQYVTVRFTPDGASTWEESLSIANDDPNEAGPVMVHVTGRVPALLALQVPASGAIRFRAAEDGPPPVDSEIRIRNDGAETLHWRAFLENDGSWLGASPDSGSVPPGNSTTIDVSVSHAGLAQGSYEATIVLLNGDRPEADRDTVSVGLTIIPFTVTTNHVPLLPDQGQNVLMKAATSVSVDSATLYYHQGGKAGWNRMAMSVHGDTACVATIPGELVGMRGLEYYVRVHAQGGEVAEPEIEIETPRRIAVRIPEAVSLTISAERHTMIGVPMLTSGAHPTDVFQDDFGDHDIKKWRLGRWFPASDAYLEYPNELGVPVEAGSGFWLITRDISTYTLSGFSTLPPPGDTTVSIGLPGGAGSWWSQIGHPFAYPVEWNRCLVRKGDGRVYPIDAQPGDGLVEVAAYTYVYAEEAGEYKEAPALEPWHGYFVNNISGDDLELLVPARESAPGKMAIAALPPLRPEDGEWEIRLRARSEAGASGEIVAGARLGAREGWDPADRHIPPAAPGGGPGLAFEPRDPMPRRGNLRADIRPPAADLCAWDVGLEFRGSREAVIEAGDEETLPAGVAVFLVDDDGGVTVPLRSGAAYRVTAGRDEKSRVLRLVAGPAAVLGASGYEATAVVTDLRLGRPYPNPALRGATIRYALPAAGPVQLQVFAITGRLVRDLVDGVRPSGEHAAVWDGRDESGREVGPGLYFFRLAQEDRVQTARVVVFR
ncbi:MAG: choice-of-anchor D domain-containing protein [Candidatus Eisenbacteria bacterium]